MHPITRRAILVGLLFPRALALAGDLTPPAGAPASTMKTLQQVEPRTPINADTTPGDADSRFKIRDSGSYYLTGDIAGVAGKAGIEIAATDVSIDLNGFRLVGAPGSLDGVRVTHADPHGYTIVNGAVRSWGGAGVNLSAAYICRVENVVAQNNGGAGLAVGSRSVVRDCVSTGNAAAGVVASFYANISGCTTISNTGTGVHTDGLSTIRDCISTDNEIHGFALGIGTVGAALTASGNNQAGMELHERCVLENCVSLFNAVGIDVIDGRATLRACTLDFNGLGIDAGISTTIIDCIVARSELDGILISLACTVTGSTCESNGRTGVGAGIRAIGSSNRIESNNLIGNDFGIRCDAADNLVVRNSSRGNFSGNYSFPAGAEYAEIVTNPGNGFVSVNTWANFAY